MTVSKRTRFEVLRRDNHTCQYCGASAPDVKLQVDHVLPVALGGTDEPVNLTTACQPCNAGKASTHPTDTLVESVNEKTIAWQAARKRALEEWEQSREVADSVCNAIYSAWTTDFHPENLPDGWQQTIRDFVIAGVPMRLLGDALDVTTSKDNLRWGQEFRYFCAVVRNMVDAIDGRAEELVREDA